jgi:hypothetical protein
MMFGLFGLNDDYGDDPYGGLLAPRDRRDAIGAALGGFAAGTLGQGYSRMPRTPFQGIGEGLARASQAYDNALNMAWQRRLLLGREKRADEKFGLEKENLARQNRMTDAQIAELERKAERDRALEDAKRQLGEIMSSHIASGGDPSQPPPEFTSLVMRTPLADEYIKSVLPRPLQRFQPIGAGGLWDTQTGKPAYIPADKEDRQLVAIHDPTSPTGIRMVPRPEARGKPGVPHAAQGPSLAQQANNEEVLAARRTLAGLNLSREEILRRSQKMTATGRDNPDYDPFIERLVRIATQRVVGMDDPEFARVWAGIYGSGANPSGTSSPQARAASPLPLTGGRIDPARLTRGTVYDDGKGGRWRWDGEAFEAAD